MTKSRALVTGCAGSIGSEVVRLLLAADFEVIGLDDLSTGKEENVAAHAGDKKFQFIKGDIRNLSLFNMLQEVGYVFHCAGMFDAKQVKQNPVQSQYVNVIGTVNVLEYCVRAKAKFIFPDIVYEEGSLLWEQREYVCRLAWQYENDTKLKTIGVMASGTDKLLAKTLFDSREMA